jgi:hypothetical protein
MWRPWRLQLKGVSVETPAAVVEGQSIDLTLRLSTASTHVATVDYATSDLTAVAPGDYTAVSGTASIPAGDTTTTVTVPTVDDQEAETTETLRLTLSAPTYATLGTSVATATIHDNDCADTVGGDSRAAAADLGSVSGNSGGMTLSVASSICPYNGIADEDWFAFTLTDNAPFPDLTDLTATVTLAMGAGGGDLDLYVYNSAGTLVSTSSSGGTTTESVRLLVHNLFGSDQSTRFYMDVVGFPAVMDGNSYTLTITGNTG